VARVLLAEDEPQIGDMVAFKLANRGHQILRAHDGEGTLTLAAAGRPDLILLDVMMPVLDGFAVLGRLKADPALRAIPVIMLTAKSQERDVLAGLRREAVDYVVKPFSLKELTAHIDLVFGRA
jgi:DNA-binding response OmpR family regulator